jgi:type I restriction enzyme M protein
MPTKRQVLDLLTRDELLRLVDRHDVIVGDRRQKAHLAERLDEKAPALPELLADLSRDRLKEICRALGLDDAGKEKAALVERIAGGAKAPSAPPPSANAGASGAGRANGAAAQQIDLPLGEKLTIDKLERHLWSAADILRGSIDSSDYKNYIFGLLFLKRLSDRFEEECEALVAEGDDPEDRDNHPFFVPKRARWSEIQKVASDLGSTLNKACAALENANTSLEGVLAGIDYNDERKLGDAKSRDVVLARLVQHFSKLGLRNASLSEPDMLGRAYEYLIEKFADDAGKKGGEFYTPRMVVKLIVDILAPREGMRICEW